MDITTINSTITTILNVNGRLAKLSVVTPVICLIPISETTLTMENSIVNTIKNNITLLFIN